MSNATPAELKPDENLKQHDFCRNCESRNTIWKGWELCNSCGHRHCFKDGWHDRRAHTPSVTRLVEAATFTRGELGFAEWSSPEQAEMILQELIRRCEPLLRAALAAIEGKPKCEAEKEAR